MRRLIGLVLVFSVLMPAFGQENGNGNSFRVYLDCQAYCDQRFVKEEFPIVDFLNERTQADVHILQTRQRTGAGGSLVTLEFMGQRDFASLADTLTFSTSPDATRDDERRAFLHHMTLGLSRYLVRAGLSDKLVVRAVRPPAGAPQEASIEHDPWNYWVFTIGGSGFMNGQASSSYITRRANLSANRTTEDLKVQFSGSANNTRREFDTGDDTIVSKTNSESLFAKVVKSIGTNWSVGGTTNLSTSSFNNTKMELYAGPAIEYDVFPYSEATRKLLTFQYNMTVTRRLYDDLTIFALEEETLLRHSLAIRLSLAQKWGSLTISTSMNHMLTNFERRMTDLYNWRSWVSANIRLFRGLSFNGHINYTRIRDQIDLKSNAATKEEILLNTVKLPSGYSYSANFGFTYRFGSIFNSVVNSRM